MILRFVLYSPFEEETRVEQRWATTLDLLFSESGNDISHLGYFNDLTNLEEKLNPFREKAHALIMAAGSGGTERLARRATELLPCPVLLLADNRNNSLAAAIEINSVAGQNLPVKLVYTPDQANARKQVDAFIKAAKALGQINSSRFGLVGEPSHWLLSSEGVSGFGAFSTELLKIPIQELLEEYEMLDEYSGDEVKEAVKEKAGQILIKDEALSDASKVFLAMQKIIGRHRLDGITIKCFDLLEHKFTACLGMALTNDKGIVATCEGDLHASFSMLLGRLLTGKPVWMANPSAIDPDNNLLTLAHCTVPFSILSDARDTTLTTHMESNLSVAIAGPLQKGPVTIFRSGPDFRSIHAVAGHIVDTNMGNKALCRTQAIIKINTSITEWVQKTPGNHQALVYGNIIPYLSDFCRFAGIDLLV